MPLPANDIIALMTRFGIASQMYQTVMEQQLAAHNLTVPQLSVLSHLVRSNQAQRVTDIARAVDVGQPAVSKILAKFDSAGWIAFAASDADKRSKSAVATPLGAQSLMRIQTSLLPGLADHLQGWSDQERDAFASLLGRLCGFFQEQRRQTTQQ